MRNKIGILGGTFNPIHNGHITLALEAYGQFGLDRVLVMLSPTPPHKAEDGILDAEKRSLMVKLAIEDYPGILEFSDFELKRSGYIYTADTLTLLKEEQPENDFYFIIGGDSLRDIETWYMPEIIFQKAVILAAVRDEVDPETAEAQIKHLKSLYNSDIRLIQHVNMSVSSSAVREHLMNGRQITGMVPEKVEKYISEHEFYSIRR